MAEKTERQTRTIGSKPAPTKTPIAKAVQRETMHPWATRSTHPRKDES